MSNGKLIFILLSVGLLLATLVMACGGVEEPTEVPTPPATPTQAVPVEEASPTPSPVEMTPSGVLSPTAAEELSGAQLLQERCTGCHSLGGVEAANKTESEWETTVEHMREHGAELTYDEAQVLVQYLVENYGP